MQSENGRLKDRLHDLEAEYTTFQRNSKREIEELKIQEQNLQRQVDEVRSELIECESSLRQYQSKLNEKENELLQTQEPGGNIKGKREDSETLALLQREFAEQSRHINRIEVQNRKLEIENQQLQSYSKSVSILEEEKRSLEIRLQALDELREYVSNLELQKAILEEERASWSAYLQDGSTDLQFTSPVHLARAYVQERFEKMALLEKFGREDPISKHKDNAIEALESNKVSLEREIGELRQSIQKNSKDRQRLERQKELALKEASFLREQLKTYSAEETVMMTGNYDDQKSQRIEELEGLLGDHKREIEALTKQLGDREMVVAASPPTKRPRNEQGEPLASEHLSKRIKVLQDELDEVQHAHQLALIEVKALQKQLAAAETTSRLRVLQLKDNPVARHEITKAETLNTLRQENQTLLAQLEGQPGGAKLVPISTLERSRLDLREMEAIVAEKEKRMLRLKEFRQAVYSILGYEVDFQPNGRVKVTSMFHRPDLYGGVDTGIIFDGEQGTMKLCGGPNSQFAREIRNQLKFYVEERKEIPCFLAALTMEGYEKTTRAQR
ncbi:hypothetical protein ABW19_dt0205622 [Dactylella cylindrospora]|nr:hypothetical protein ABW19_dt0205622 [Dactylella cylindrospora]